jgi:hypothetical protein
MNRYIKGFVNYVHEEICHFEFVMPTHKEVCDYCRGEGKSSAYLGSYTQSEMDEQGPEFYEDYMAGAYDQECPECRGLRVVDVVDEERLPEDLRREWQDYVREMYAMDAEIAAERRMGA